MEVIRESQQKEEFKIEKPKQNYAPFIAKCPRFQSPKNIISQPQIQDPVLDHGGRITVKNSVHVTPNKHNPGQYIFKSGTERFEASMVKETPSPGSYRIEGPQRMKTLDSSSRGKQSNQNKQCTLPTIPDKRNRFGVNFQMKEISFVEKSETQLLREKELMKKYRQSLSEEVSLKKSGIMAPAHFQLEIQHKVKAYLQNSGPEKENKSEIRKSQSQNRIKVQHLYDYHPVDNARKPSPFFGGVNFWEKKGKKTKYQFFDSTEKRFKDLGGTAKQEEMLKKSVRNYLQKMAAVNSK